MLNGPLIIMSCTEGRITCPHLWTRGWRVGSGGESSDSRSLPGFWCRTDCFFLEVEVAHLPSLKLFPWRKSKRSLPLPPPQIDSQTCCVRGFVWLLLRCVSLMLGFSLAGNRVLALRRALLLSHLSFAEFSVDNSRTDSEVRRLYGTKHCG